ncbi:MAG: glycerophosphodiester phosphodiesterase [Clostridiaceae bacterium]|jgi:glycerophosphoryl diester phosphodiesterase|nr:glycerophosphodiester phosphodiesterase [Clostridiaceae bacterium]
MTWRSNSCAIKIFAHRGASEVYPENTMLAFYESEKAGADGIELDVLQTRDSRAVVVHDENLERLSGQSLWVKDLTWDELSAINIAAHFPEHDPQQVPALDDVLDWILTTSLEVNIELKNSDTPIPGLEEDVLRLIDARKMRHRVIVSSFSLESVICMKKLAPDLRCGYLVKRPTRADLRRAKEHNIDAIHPHIFNVYRPGFTRSLLRLGFAVRYWTATTERQYRTASRQNATAIIVNDPAQARAILSKSSFSSKKRGVFRRF